MKEYLHTVVGIIVALIAGAALYTVSQTVILLFIAYAVNLPWSTGIGAVLWTLAFLGWYDRKIKK